MTFDEEKRLSDLFSRFGQPLRKYFVAHGYSSDDAQDLIQETFLTAFKQGTDWDRGARANQSLLKSIAWNVARARGRRAEPPLESLGISDVLAAPPRDLDLEIFTKGQLQALEDSVAKLPPRMRLCVRLWLQGCEYSEISTLLGVSPQTVRSRLYSARSRLRQELLLSESSRPNTASEAVADAPGLEAEIDSAYEAIAVLSILPASLKRDAWVEQTFTRLRELQHREAEQFRQQFEDNLMMPLDAGASILGRSRNLRKQLEDLAAPDSSAEEPAST